MSAPLSAITVDCYVRAASVVPPVDEFIETLRDYDQQGVIDDLTVGGWPDEVVLTTDTEVPPPIAQYRRFQTWAEQTDVSLRPSFTIRERTSLVSDQPKTILVPPVLCLAIHVNGELGTVVPHKSDTTTYTVEDALADLAALDRDSPARPPISDSAAEPRAPPTSTTGPPK